MNELPKLSHHTDWLLMLLLLIALLLGLLRFRHAQRFRDLIQLPFHLRRRELEIGFRPSWRSGGFEIGLSIVSYLTLGLALFILVRHHQVGRAFSDWQMYLRIAFVVAVFFLLKNLLGLLVGWIFNCSDEVASSQNTNLAYRCWMSLLLLPLIALAVFWPPGGRFIYLIILLFLVVAYGVALQFTALRIWNIPAKGYYKIFYLCALEITPLVFLVGWLKNLY